MVLVCSKCDRKYTPHFAPGLCCGLPLQLLSASPSAPPAKPFIANSDVPAKTLASSSNAAKRPTPKAFDQPAAPIPAKKKPKDTAKPKPGAGPPSKDAKPAVYIDLTGEDDEEDADYSKHWYTDDDINLLLKRYSEDEDRGSVEVVALKAVMGTAHAGVGGIELEHTLSPVARPEAGGPWIFIPVNLGNLHWVGLCLTPDGAFYFDPAGHQPHADVLVALSRSLGDVQVYHTDLVFQTDGHNCGPWIVQWFRALQDGGALPRIADMAEVRGTHLLLPEFRALVKREQREERAETRSWVGVPFKNARTPTHKPLGTLKALRAGTLDNTSGSTAAVAAVTYQQFSSASAVLERYPLNGGKLISNHNGEHAEPAVCESYREWAGRAAQSRLPHVLSIKLNRAPCEACAKALCKLLLENRHLSIRVRASAATEEGIRGLRYLSRLRELGLPIYLRAVPPSELAAKFQTKVDDLNRQALNQYRPKDERHATKGKNKKSTGAQPEPRWRGTTFSELSEEISDAQLEGAEKRTLERYLAAWKRELTWEKEHLPKIASAYEVGAKVVASSWRARSLSKAHLLGPSLFKELLDQPSKPQIASLKLKGDVVFELSREDGGAKAEK